MTESEKEALVGKLVLEYSELEKKIAMLRAEASRRAGPFANFGRLLSTNPERIVFAGVSFDSRFEGERAIDRKDLDAQSMLSLVEEIRAAVIRKDEVRGSSPKWGSIQSAVGAKSGGLKC